MGVCVGGVCPPLNEHALNVRASIDNFTYYATILEFASLLSRQAERRYKRGQPGSKKPEVEQEMDERQI